MDDLKMVRVQIADHIAVVTMDSPPDEAARHAPRLFGHAPVLARDDDPLRAEHDGEPAGGFPKANRPSIEKRQAVFKGR
jgi:hypothetical protein